MILSTLLNNFFPLTVRLILGKALLFFIVWKFVFLFFLRETKIVDYPLTENVGEYSTMLLNTFVSSPEFTVKREFRKDNNMQGKVFQHEVSQVYYNKKKVAYVDDGCNGLELMVGFIGFIFCLPSPLKRKIKYLILGLLTIYCLNILRCSGLIYINLYYQPYFDLAHRYWLKGAMYSIVFIMWMLYLRKVDLDYYFPKTKMGTI